MAFDVSNFLSGLRLAGDAQIAAATRAMGRFAQHVIGDSQQLTPVATGALQASGTTEPAHSDDGKITVKIGHNTSYAAAVHEDLTAAHRVGQAKFLSTAMSQNNGKMAAFVAGEVKAATGG